MQRFCVCLTFKAVYYSSRSSHNFGRTRVLCMAAYKSILSPWPRAQSQPPLLVLCPTHLPPRLQSPFRGSLHRPKLSVSPDKYLFLLSIELLSASSPVGNNTLKTYSLPTTTVIDTRFAAHKGSRKASCRETHTLALPQLCTTLAI